MGEEFHAHLRRQQAGDVVEFGGHEVGVRHGAADNTGRHQVQCHQVRVGVPQMVCDEPLRHPVFGGKPGRHVPNRCGWPSLLWQGLQLVGQCGCVHNGQVRPVEFGEQGIHHGVSVAPLLAITSLYQ